MVSVLAAARSVPSGVAARDRFQAEPPDWNAFYGMTVREKKIPHDERVGLEYIKGIFWKMSKQ